MRLKPSYFLIVFLIIPHLVVSQNDTSIRGNMQVDTTMWDSKIFLSHITSFESMYAVSRDFIIAETGIEPNGDFSFGSSFLPEEEELYRLHIVKKNDPPTSLSIGGIDQNHIFVLASKSRGVVLESFSKEFPFSKIQVTGSNSSVDFQRVNIVASYKDSTAIDGQVVKPEFIAQTIDKRLRTMADSLDNPITATYALYRTNFEKYVLENPAYFTKYIEKWNANTSPYLDSFEEKLGLPKTETSSILWWQLIGLGLLFFFGGMLFSNWKSKPTQEKPSKVQLLSVQERKVFQLMQEGRSNKDISEELSIGISTVKSHVSNIYSKLEIKSRKEAMDIKS